MHDEPVIGLDIGGANTKAALVQPGGAVRTASEPLELWRDLDGLLAAIASVVRQVEPERESPLPVALTTTAELVDVFASKREGVLRVLAAAQNALPGRELRVLTHDGDLIAVHEAERDPLRCAAANWIATARLVARSVADAILVDCGGTTTDIVPIAGSEVVAQGRTDLERLLASELVYTGALRTNVAAIVSELPVGGRRCPVASELFAISADAHLLLGSLTPAQCTCSFPDRRDGAPDRVRARLARVVCADPDELGDADLEAIATAVADAQVEAIASALQRVAARVPTVVPVVAVGVGAFLARAAAERCGIAGLDRLGPPAAALTGPGGEVAASTALSVLARG